MNLKKMAISTSGGDAPGMNAASTGAEPVMAKYGGVWT